MSSNSELLCILESVPIQDLLSTIRKKAKTGNKDVVSYIRAIFQGSSDRSAVAEDRRLETFKCALSLLEVKDLPYNTISELLSLLILKVDLFQTSNLVKLAEIFVDHAKKSDKFGNKWLEIFSKVLSCLAHRDSIVYQGTDMSGSELRKNIIASLFSDDSDSSCLVQLASVLKDVDMSEEEISLVVERLLKILPGVELIELPPFIYQLLLISSKGKCRHVLQSILSHFILKDKKMQNLLYEDTDSESLIDNQEHNNYRQSEGTVILMISVVCRHDQKVAKEFLLLLKKMLHKPQLILSPFTFSTALSLTKIHRNSDDIFDILKKSIVAAFQHKEKRQNSVWFRNLIQWDEDVLKLVKEAVKCSKFGWDHVCQGLVRFGFVALDAFGPRCIAGHATTKPVLPEGCELGSHIIRDTFKSHRLVRQEIFEQILNRIITKTQKPVSHYIDILSQIVQSDPLFLLDVLPKLVEIMDYLHFLPHTNAEKVLQSLAPLLKVSAPLKDTLMLVLRKALFHRDMEARKVAVCGYLTILKKINFIGKVSLSQSQTSVGSHASSSSMISTQVKADVYVSAGNPTSKTMCLEIMGLLKRALMQQNEVRQLLYEGLYDVVLQNKSLKDIILELLLGQFEKHYNAIESEIPLHFSLCFQDQKNIILLEPLAHLITSIFLILSEGSTYIVDEDYDQSAQKILENIMQKLIKRMLVVDDTDFHIAKDVDLDESKTENNLKIRLLLNIYESLIEYSFMQNPEFESEDCEEFLRLYRKYKQIFESTSKKKQNKTSKFKANLTHHLFSHVTLNFVAKVMEALFLDETFKHQEGLQLLRSHSEFVIHIVTACNQRFTKMSDSGHSDGFSKVMKNSFNYVITIGKVLLKTYSDGLNSEFPSDVWDKLSSLFAEGLSCIFNFVHLFYRKNMNKFIISISDNTCLSATEALQYILKSIQKSVMKLLSDTDDDSNLKECIPLLSVIKNLYAQFMTEFKEDIYKWIKQLCSQQVFQNVAVSKAFISLCFSLGHQNENFLGFLKEVAFDIRYHLGNIDPDESVTGTPKYEIITLDVAKNVLPILFSNLEQCFEEIEWVLNFIKINTLGGNDSVELWNIYNQLSIEQGICSRVSDVILIFYEVVQTGVSEHLANSILKLVTRLYKVLTALTKYYLLLHKNKASGLHVAFEKLVKLSNMKLTTQVYAFVTFIQMLSGEGNDKKKKAKGNTGAFKAVQDMKTIPSLVFEIESYEKNLIILSKKYKKDLTNKMKASTARDFRINAAVITTVLEQQENESIADTTADETNNEDDVSARNSPQNQSTHASPEKDESDDHMSVNGNSSDEAPNENEPLNTSLNIFGEDVPVTKVKATPRKEQLNVKRKRLGIRGNIKRK